VDALDAFNTAGADKLRLKLASSGHTNAGVVARAIGQLAGHRQKLPADEVLALCRHHRKQVRDAARTLNAAQGGKDPGPFDPATAMQSPPMKAILAELQTWTPDVLPAKDAELTAVTVRYLDDEKIERKKETYLGWLIGKKGNTVRLLLPGGSVEEFTHGEMGSLHVFATSSTPVTSEVSTNPAEVEALVVAAAGARKRAAQLAETRGESPGLSRAEVFAGVWLVQAGRTVEAATLLLPALDAHDSDQYLLEFARREIGSVVGGRMMLAFGASRSGYTEALEIARRVDTVYRGTKYHALARRLLTELPKRADDGKTFTLPTPEEWKTLKAKLSREEQVDYLASRLRLIRMTPGYEGAYFPEQAQFADAEGKTLLVNPYSELVGNTNEWHWPECPKAEGLKLTLKDVPALARHLKDDWLTLCTGFDRDGYSRTNRGLLHRTINQLADHDLCAIEVRNEERWGKLMPKEVDAEIGRIMAWAKAHETPSEVDLQWALYRQEIKGAESFSDVAKRVEKLLSHALLAQERRTEVLEAMARFHQRTDSTWERQRILQAYRDFEPKAGLVFAEACLKEQGKLPLKGRDRSLRFIAAQIVFAAGDKAKVRTLIGEELATGELDGRFNVWEPVVRLLLKHGGKESLAAAVRLFENKDLVQVISSSGRAEVLQRFVAAGRTEPYCFYHERLDDEKSAERFAVEITTEFAKDDADVKKIVADHPKTADRIPHLKTWLDAKSGKKE
jgi:hypothetical protein